MGSATSTVLLVLFNLACLSLIVTCSLPECSCQVFIQVSRCCCLLLQLSESFQGFGITETVNCSRRALLQVIASIMFQ